MKSKSFCPVAAFPVPPFYRSPGTFVSGIVCRDCGAWKQLRRPMGSAEVLLFRAVKTEKHGAREVPVWLALNIFSRKCLLCVIIRSTSIFFLLLTARSTQKTHANNVRNAEDSYWKSLLQLLFDNQKAPGVVSSSNVSACSSAKTEMETAVPNTGVRSNAAWPFALSPMCKRSIYPFCGKEKKVDAGD